MGAGGDAPWDVDRRDGGSLDGLGVEDDELGLIRRGLVDESEEPAAVLDAGAARISDEDKFARGTTGAEIVAATSSGGQIVLVRSASADRPEESLGSGVPPVARRGSLGRRVEHLAIGSSG